MEESKNLNPKQSEFLFYTTPEGDIQIDVFFKDETVWLTQLKMAKLFGVDRSVIVKHLQNIYSEEELNKDSTSAKIAQVQKEGNREVNREIEYYNLDAIIAVGYRVNSKQATHFRIWATQTLREYIIKGFAIDDERLKNGTRFFNKDYFKELLERVRSIRAKEYFQEYCDLDIDDLKIPKGKFISKMAKDGIWDVICNVKKFDRRIFDRIMTRLGVNL